ncbi:MAG: serine/threonine protein kinase, partial [Planctomycetota bacterium]|nr:serine/threonine protein kinase [Planctomycetota bacterium]
MNSDRPAIQQVIPGYELLEKIGQGGMGAVYRARQQSMDRIVALKILPKSLARRTEFKERFFREARAAGKLNHPNIVSAYDAQEANGYCYIAMEFVEGETVANKLKREGAIPEEEALHIAHQIAAGLAHAWKNGIVHRDVKPENFLYTKDRIAKLCDLGIAKAPADANLTQDGIALGTPRYISPEQARGIADLDYRTDIYSLGASLYHMLAGVPPFDGPTPAAIMLAHVNDPLPPLRSRAPHVSKAIAQVVERMMAKEPDSRYTSPEDFLADLEALQRGEIPPIAGASKRPSVRRVAPRRSSASRPARSRNVGGILALAAIAAVLLFAAAFWPSSEASLPLSTSAGDKEERALEALRQAREWEKSGGLERALIAYQQLLADYPDTKAALLAKGEMEKAQ